MSQPIMPPAERIRELSSINADVPAMLTAAGSAIGALTNKPLTNTDENDMSVDGASEDAISNPNAHKEAFRKHTTTYFTHLQSIMARLRRQAYALEEAGIIAAEVPTLSTTGAATEGAVQRAAPRRGAPGLTGATSSQRPADEGDRIKNGGLGNLDVGWLNSRSNSVGLEKEAELVAEAKAMLKDMLGEREEPAA